MSNGIGIILYYTLKHECLMTLPVISLNKTEDADQVNFAFTPNN
jgi:hypothetical protein